MQPEQGPQSPQLEPQPAPQPESKQEKQEEQEEQEEKARTGLGAEAAGVRDDQSNAEYALTTHAGRPSSPLGRLNWSRIYYFDGKTSKFNKYVKIHKWHVKQGQTYGLLTY